MDNSIFIVWDQEMKKYKYVNGTMVSYIDTREEAIDAAIKNNAKFYDYKFKTLYQLAICFGPTVDEETRKDLFEAVELIDYSIQVQLSTQNNIINFALKFFHTLTNIVLLVAAVSVSNDYIGLGYLAILGYSVYRYHK